MNENVLIVEDEFIVANDLRLLLGHAGYHVCAIVATVEEAREAIKNNRVDIVLLDIHLKGKLSGIDLAKELRVQDIAFVYLSANSNKNVLEAAKATEPYGFLVKPFREKDVLVTLEIARYRHSHSHESRLRRESSLHSALVSISTEPLSMDEKLIKMVPVFQECIPFDYLSEQVRLEDGRPHGVCSFLRIGFKEYQRIGMPELSVVSRIRPDELYSLMNNSAIEKMAALFNGNEFDLRCEQNKLKRLVAATFKLESEITYPVFTKNKGIVVLSFFSRNPHAYNSEHLALLIRMQQTLLAIFDEMPVAENESIKSGISTSNIVARNDSGEVSSFAGIIGNSPLLLHMLDLVTQVAPLDTSVLLLGESGTGKERIADCIHNLSSRRNKPLIKVNCAALPANLMESELFGHEKGSFTGAADKKIGKFELASGGTIFLDEIGELPPDQQVKLLRALQEREIERIGGKQPIKVDIRVIAATNRDLEKEVAERRFRLDLYYRLNVFPIELPALRERKEDINKLALYFATRLCGKINKPFNGLSKQMTEELEAYDWPGNIRELENIIEQSVIVNDGKSEISLRRTLQHTSPQHEFERKQPTMSDIKSLSDIKDLSQRNEREYIISILRKTNGRIRGNGGAAELLNQKPTTLESRIAKLGINREDYYK